MFLLLLKFNDNLYLLQFTLIVMMMTILWHQQQARQGTMNQHCQGLIWSCSSSHVRFAFSYLAAQHFCNVTRFAKVYCQCLLLLCTVTAKVYCYCLLSLQRCTVTSFAKVYCYCLLSLQQCTVTSFAKVYCYCLLSLQRCFVTSFAKIFFAVLGPEPT